MFEPLKKIFSASDAKRAPRLPAGQRAYIIGDVHGRCDLFEALIDAIEADDAAAQNADTSIILLGDLIDRGSDSAGVVAVARELADRRKLRCLMGNHEEMFLDSLSDTGVLRHFLKHGGRETILSYGVSRKDFNDADLNGLQTLMRESVPHGDIAFIQQFEDMIEMGGYLFVHAGIDPKKPLEDQETRELRWIREPFLKHRDHHSHMVVHGHTITDEIDARKNRIGIDTGAYRNGVLTALVLEDDNQRYIQAVEKKKNSIMIVAKETA